MRVGSAPAQARARDANDRRSLFAVVVVLQGRWTCAHLRPRLLPLGDPRPVRRPRLSPATRGRRRCPFSRRHFLRRSCSARVHHPPHPAPPRRQRRVRHGCRVLEGRGRRPRGRLRQLQRRPRQPRVRRDGPPHHEGLPRGARVRPARGLGHRLRRALPRGVGGRPRPGQHLNPGAGQRGASAGRDHIQAGVAVPRKKTRRVARGEESRENPRHALPGQGEGHARAGVLLEGRRAVHVPCARSVQGRVQGWPRAGRVQAVQSRSFGFLANDGWIQVPPRRGEDWVRQGQDAGPACGAGRAGAGPGGYGAAPRERPRGGPGVEQQATEPEVFRHQNLGAG